MKKFSIVLLLFAMPICAEVRFNALDKSDPHYTEFNAVLCGYTLGLVKRMDNKLQEISAKLADANGKAEKKELLEDFTVASELKKSWSADYMNFCRP